MVNVTSADPEFTPSLNCRGKLLDLSKPVVMGVLNLTPDSFSDGGAFNTEKTALQRAEKMLAEGAEIIDVGAQSTRPGAALLSATEEKDRLGSIIKKIVVTFPDAIISLDTFHAEVAHYGFDQGCTIINDISGGNFDPKMFETVGLLDIPYVLMHNANRHSAMHREKLDGDVIISLNRYFSEKINEIQRFGVKDIILDPGFGFGKTVDQQHQLIEEFQFLSLSNRPLLAGISRKSFIYKPLGRAPGEVDDETQAMHLTMLQKGARILRVHEVASAKKTVEKYVASVQI